MTALSRIERRRAVLRLQIASDRVAACAWATDIRARAAAALTGLSFGRLAGSALGRGGIRRVLVSLAVALAAYALARRRREP